MQTPSSSLPTAYCVQPTPGIVGPMSNYATPPQLVENAPYQNLDEMHRFARKWRDERRGRWFTVPKLSGFCLLMKRAVYEKIGGLDERFGLGFFDDDDFAERALRAGFGLAVAHDLFVHHFGSRTFTGNGIDSEKLLDDNARQFAAKWGKSVPKGRRVALEPWSSCPQFFADSQRDLHAGSTTPRTRRRAYQQRPGPAAEACRSEIKRSSARRTCGPNAQDQSDGHCAE